MKHRKQRLIDIACYFFHRDLQIQETISSERERWLKMAQQSVDDEHFSHQIEVLIATFDLKNWKEVELPDQSKALAFEEPEHLKPSPEYIEKRDKKILKLTLPTTCRRMIDEGSNLKNQEIPAFIKRSKDLLGYESDDKEVSEFSSVTDCLLGTATVLFMHHREWLSKNPEEEKWCIEVLDQSLTTTPDNFEVSTPMSLKSYDGELFAADIATIIWSESPMDIRAKTRVLNLALTLC